MIRFLKNLLLQRLFKMNLTLIQWRAGLVVVVPPVSTNSVRQLCLAVIYHVLWAWLLTLRQLFHRLYSLPGPRMTPVYLHGLVPSA